MLVLFVACFIKLALAGSSCPTDLEYATCHCTSPNHVTSVKCKESSTIEQLSADIKALSDRSIIVQEFYIHSNFLKVVGPNYFGNITVVEATFSAVNLTTVHKDAFAGQENSLERLYFAKTELTEPPVACIAGLKKLFDFAVYSNSRITAISLSSSVPKNQLINLDLSGNEITSVDLDVGKCFPKLRTLYLDNNKLVTAPKIVLPVGNSIQAISLSDNQLNSIPTNLLKTMDAGSKLFLRDNTIANIYEDEVKLSIKNRIDVNLVGNPIACGCNFRWILNYTYHSHLQMEARCDSPKTMRRYFLKHLRKTYFKWCDSQE